MQILCVQCGELIELPLADAKERIDLVCPRCGARSTLRGLGSQPGRPGPAPAAEAGGEEPDTRPAHPRPPSTPEKEPERELGDETLFQPGLTFQSLLAGELTPGPAPREPQELQGPQQGPETTETVDPEAIAEPPLMPPQVEAFFLVLGAEPGRQRLPLTKARTVVGRQGCDLNLRDRGVSNPHFRIDAMGNEFYVQDLGSHNGTHLNGRRIRHCQLLPGDEVRAGRIILMFRTAGDGLSARAAAPP